MCGICGIMSRWLNDNEIDIFKNLMMMSCLRGMDGSGTAFIPEHKTKANVLRSRSHGLFLVNSPEFEAIMKRGKMSVLLGHTRLPTKGPTTDINNVHPHRSGHIVGVHNGTFTSINHEFIKPDESDSAKLFASIANVGIQETINVSTGAYALVWIDEKEQTINFLRNNQRPLYFAKPEKAEHPLTLAWASEPDFLKLIFNRAGITPTIYDLSADQMLTFTYPLKGQLDARSVKEVKKEYPKLIGKAWDWNDNDDWETEDNKQFGRMYGDRAGRDPWRNRKHGKGLHNRTSVPVIIDSQAADAKERANDLFRKGQEEYWRTHDEKNKDTAKKLNLPASETSFIEVIPGRFITPRQLVDKLASGCEWCQRSFTLTDQKNKKLTWKSTESFVCNECIDNDGDKHTFPVLH